ncbi:MAG: hypothetical protein ACE5EX_09850, partial [Phycisphaerae bacterium]
GYTRRGQMGETLWLPGEWHEAKGLADQGLCTDGWLHFYADPLLAVFHAPWHGQPEYGRYRLWECEVDGEVRHDGLIKSGARRLRVVREIGVPVVTTINCVAYSVLCAMSVCDAPGWVRWAERWLSGVDRTHDAARAAAWDPARDAAWAAAGAAAQATRAATRAAADAARAAADAAWAAADAARATAEVDLLLFALAAMEVT